MNVPAFTMPENAAEQMVKSAETRDYYRDLSDSEREAEGLLPREPAAEAEPVAATPTPTAAPADDGAEPEGDAETEQLFEEVARLTESIAQLTPAATDAEKKDELIEALLEHEDPAMQAVGERLKQQGAELAQMRAEKHQAIVDAQEKKVVAEYTAVQRSYQVDGKPLSDDQIDQVLNYMEKNPALGAVLSIEEATLRVFPGAVKVKAAQSPPAKGPGASAKNNGGEVATIVTEGASGGAPSGPWTPRPNETIDSAMEAARARLFPGAKR